MNSNPIDERHAKNELNRLAQRVSSDPQTSNDESLANALGEEATEQLELLQLPADFMLTVVMPVYNERDTIGDVITRVLSTCLPIELIIVDDGSTDGTREVLADIDVGLVSAEAHSRSTVEVRLHERNLGKGGALRTAFGQFQGDVVVIQDADTEYDPREFYRLLLPIVRDETDVVYGSRFLAQSQSSSPGWHRFGNRTITRLSNLFTRQRFTDVETCYKMMRREFLTRISDSLRERGFGIELEMTAKLAKQKGIRFLELPISYEKRSYAEGKKIGWKDGVWALWCILRY